LRTKGFVSVCKNETEQECFRLMLFGSVKSWFDRVDQVKRGDAGFLLNLDKDVLYGIFRAETDGTLNIVPDAWGGRFPAQIRVSWEKKCAPLPNAKESLKGLGIYHAKYILTPEEVATVRAVFEKEFFVVRPGLRPSLEQTVFKTDDGHFVKSKSEAMIDNWLYHQGLAHAYERKVPISEDLTCDFYVPVARTYVEYWGLEGYEDYEKRKEKKINLYQRHQLNLIGLRDKDIERIDDILPKELARHLPKGFRLL